MRLFAEFLVESSPSFVCCEVEIEFSSSETSFLCMKICYLVKGLKWDEIRGKNPQKSWCCYFLPLVHIWVFVNFIPSFSRCRLQGWNFGNFMSLDDTRNFVFCLAWRSIRCCCCCRRFYLFIRTSLADIGGAKAKIINILIHSEYKLMVLFVEFKSFFLPSLRNSKIFETCCSNFFSVHVGRLAVLFEFVLISNRQHQPPRSKRARYGGDDWVDINFDKPLSHGNLSFSLVLHRLVFLRDVEADGGSNRGVEATRKLLGT